MSGIDYVKSRFAEKWESLMREGREAQRDGVLREQSPYAPGDECSLPWALGWDAEHEKAKERAVERVKELESALAAVTARAETAEAVAGNMLNHLLPDTIRAIVLDLSAAERHAPDMGEFAITPQTLEFRDKCATFLGAEWPDSAWDEEWLTALDAERARRARSEQDEVQSRAT